MEKCKHCGKPIEPIMLMGEQDWTHTPVPGGWRFFGCHSAGGFPTGPIPEDEGDYYASPSR